MTLTFYPLKNPLSISLTESVLFLRTTDLCCRRFTPQNAPPSMLRGLLILTLVRPTRISSIQVDLLGRSMTTWTEGPSTRYPAEMQDKNILFSATQTFFRAPCTTTGRRALSLDPGLTYYADEDDPVSHRRPSLSLARGDRDAQEPFHPVNLARGRERGRVLQRDPPPDVHSPSSTALGSPSLASSGDDISFPPLYSPADASSTPSSLRSAPRQRTSTISPSTSPPNLPHETRSFPHPLSISSSSSPSPRPISRPPSVSHLPLPADLGLHSSSHHEFSPPPTRRRVSFDDNSLEGPRSQSRGRMSARFTLSNMSSSILEAVRSVSGAPIERRRGGESSDDSHRGRLREAVGQDGNKQGSDHSTDGWQEFKKGTYTFPISFAIPAHMPPTVECEHGSVTWRLKATVHRPGTFTPKLSASREVILVASPSEDHSEDADSHHFIERFWEDQMQYVLSVSGRVFPIGGVIPLTLSLLPMTKVKIFKISVHLEERVDYYYTFSSTACRKEPERRFRLLSLRSMDENIPILPLSQVAPSTTNPPLFTLFEANNDNASEFIANLMGPGPWTFPMALTVPDVPGMLHFSNKNPRAPIEISHTLKVVICVERGDGQPLDLKTGRPKQFDIVMRVPVHILSPLSNPQHTSLPRYSESLDAPSPAAASSHVRDHEHALHYSHHSVVLQSPASRSVSGPLTSPEERSLEVDALYERNVMFERLITGQQSEDGVAPPAYHSTS